MELVTRNFWWPGVIKEVKQYMEGCDSCQRNKNCIEQPAGKLMPNSMVQFIPTTEKITAEGLAKLFRDNM